MAIPRYTLDEKIPHTYTAGLIHGYNRALQQSITGELERALAQAPFEPDAERFALITLGSDARMEKGPKSTMELIILHNSLDTDTIAAFNSMLSGFLTEHEERLGKKLFSDVESKELAGDTMSLYRGRPDCVFPGRIIEGRPLLGNERLFDEAVRRVCHEFTLHPRARSFYNALKTQKRVARKRMLTGSAPFHGETAVHYDWEKGEAYYDDSSRGSFKYGPLRYVQAVLLRDLLAYARAHPKKGPDFIAYMPSNIAERLAFFRAERVTRRTPEELATLTDHYTYFLREYHLSQKRYQTARSTTRLFNVAEARTRIAALNHLLEQPVMNIND